MGRTDVRPFLLLASMFFSINNKDLFDKYKQQTYRLVFPLGVAITSLYTIVITKEGSLHYYMGICMAIFLSALSALIWRGVHFLAVVELLFYFMIVTFFFLLTNESLSELINDGKFEYQRLSDYINSLGLWLVVFMVSGFLTLPKDKSIFLTIYIFGGMAFMGLDNLAYLASVGRLDNSYLFRWINPLSGLAIAIVLIQRMGMLQQKQAATDSLTGLLNRRALYQIFDAEMERSARYNKTFSVILFDVDKFKDINDVYGHFVGDHVLRGIADLIRRAIRQTDSLGRWGGEEFLLLLPETDIQSAKAFAERIKLLLCSAKFGKVENVTASFGVASYLPESSLEEILHRADRAMYQAKESGRNQVAVWRPE